jgi:hypothetical protein
VEMDEFGISESVRVTPSANFNNLRFVTILKEHK